MKKQILICAVCALLLSSCGKVDAGNADDISKQENESSITESETTNELTDSVSTNNVQAATSSINLFGDDLCSKISSAKELYSFVTDVKNNSETVENASNDKILSVGFKDDDDEYTLSYSSDNFFRGQSARPHKSHILSPIMIRQYSFGT